MFLIWGERVTNRKIGHVAEYCQDCDKITRFSLVRKGLASHLFFISVSKGQLIDNCGICQECFNEYQIVPMEYASMKKKRDKMDIEQLILETNPKLAHVNKSSQGEYERESAIRAPFLNCSRAITNYNQQGGAIDWIGVLALLIFPFVLLSSLYVVFNHFSDKYIPYGAGFTVIGCIVGLSYILANKSKRYFNRELYPVMLERLKALNPKREELEFCLAGLKKYSYPVAGVVSSDKILRDVNESSTDFSTSTPQGLGV